jgi:rubrerythrin
MVGEMTETNLRSAFAGESQAHIKYKIFAERAEKSGWPNVARLFNTISLAERIHAGNHFRNILSKGGFQTVSAARAI